MGKQKRERSKGIKADYRNASPKRVAEALLRYRTQPGMKSKRFINPPREANGEEDGRADTAVGTKSTGRPGHTLPRLHCSCHLCL